MLWTLRNGHRRLECSGQLLPHGLGLHLALNGDTPYGSRTFHTQDELLGWAEEQRVRNHVRAARDTHPAPTDAVTWWYEAHTPYSRPSAATEARPRFAGHAYRAPRDSSPIPRGGPDQGGHRPEDRPDTRTIGSVLQGEDFERLKIEIESDTFDDARRVLKAHVVKAAKAWPRAIEKAADKGDHKPAKDLLMHTGVIEPLGEDGAHGALVLVGVNVYQDVRTGQQFKGQPDPNRPVWIVGSPELFEEYERAGLPPPMPVPTQEEIEAAQRKSGAQPD